MFRSVLGLILVALPIMELMQLVRCGQLVGFWATFALVVGAGILGTFVLSRQSRGALRRAAAALEEGRPPMADALDGAFLMMAGLLLITPGFVTDFFALLLLIPPLRHALTRWTIARMGERAGIHAQTVGADGAQPSPADQGKGPIIEGEFERLDEKPVDPPSLRH